MMGKIGFNYARGFSSDGLKPFDVQASHRRAEEALKKMGQERGATADKAEKNIVAASARLEELRGKLMKKDSWWRKNTPVTLVNWVWGILLVVFLVCLIFTLVKIF